MESASDIEVTFRKMLNALASGDLADYEAQFLVHPDLRIILTAEDEWSKGPAGIGSVARRRTREIGLTGVEISRLEGFSNGDTGWGAADVVAYTVGGPVSLRITAVFVREAEWKVAQWHASSGVPNTQAWGVELTKSLSDLLSDLGDDLTAGLDDVAPGGGVSFLFSDIVDSTRIGAELGDAAWTSLIGLHFAETRRIVVGHRGRLIKTLGDGGMAAFGSATDAVEAGIELQHATVSSEFGIRVGVHSGPALRMGGDYYGGAVNKAARVAAAARGGEVLVSQETSELLGNLVALVDRGVFELKGLPGTHRLFALDFG